MRPCLWNYPVCKVSTRLLINVRRFFLQKGAKVILAVNSEPSLNDITATELDALMESIVHVDESIASAWSSGRLKVMETGSASPTIDLSRLDAGLVKECADCDFIVVEGMGRVCVSIAYLKAIHTNYYAEFAIDSLKIAVFKNQFTAERLRARLYDGICLFQKT
jgi:hypothetical protein